MTDVKDYTRKPWRKVPLDKLRTPREGALCMMNHWWVITPDQCVLFYNGTPQCNSNEKVTKYLLGKLHTGCEAIAVDVAYLDHDCHDYVF